MDFGFLLQELDENCFLVFVPRNLGAYRCIQREPHGSREPLADHIYYFLCLNAWHFTQPKTLVMDNLVICPQCSSLRTQRNVISIRRHALRNAESRLLPDSDAKRRRLLANKETDRRRAARRSANAGAAKWVQFPAENT